MSAQSLADMLREYLDKPVETPPPPVIKCEICGDLGVVSYNAAVGDPRFGKLFPCPNPECETNLRRQRERVSKIAQDSAWGAEYDAWTFDSFSRLSTDKKLGALAAAQYFAVHAGEAFDLHAAARAAFGQDWPDLRDARPKQSLVLTGEPGLGKTGLAVAAVNLLKWRGIPVLFFPVRKVIKAIQDAYSADKRQESEIAGDKMLASARIAFFAGIQVLVLDEFNLQNYTPDRLEIMAQIMRDRDRLGLPFMATTNLTEREFYEFWKDEVADIVAKAHWVKVRGAKLRATSQVEEDGF